MKFNVFYKLCVETEYLIEIRIPNIPQDHLGIEVINGTITRIDSTDHFVLKTLNKKKIYMAIGFYPNNKYMTFKNFIEEVQFDIVLPN